MTAASCLKALLEQFGVNDRVTSSGVVAAI